MNRVSTAAAEKVSKPTGAIPGNVALSFLLVLITMLIGAGCKGEEDRPAPEPFLPAKTSAFLYQTQQMLRQGDYRGAMAWVDSAAHYAPGAADVHLMRGRVFSEMRRLEEADSAYKQALSVRPDYAGVWFNLGNTALRRERYDEALRYYQEAQKHQPKAATLVRMGHAYAGLGQPEREQEAYVQAIGLDPSHAAAHILLSQAVEDAGDLTEALEHAQEALRLEPDNLDYRYVVGSQLFRIGRIEEAVDYLSAVVKGLPWHAGAQHNLGLALVRLGQEDRAEGHFKTAADLREMEQKIEEFETLADLNPDDPARWAALAFVYSRSGRLDEAVEAYRFALYLDPANVMMRTDYANLHLARGDAQSAVFEYREALSQDSTAVEAWLNLGVAYASLGDAEKARQAWQTVLRHAPDHADANSYLAQLAARTSR